MKYCDRIEFPELTFTSPGRYWYTVRELTPSSRNWKTDDRVYRILVVVRETEDGELEASIEYPDGFPRFVNICCCDCHVCRRNRKCKS